MGRVPRAVFAGAVVAVALAATPATIVESRVDWHLFWSDEFNGVANTGVTTTEWIYDLGTRYENPAGPDQWGTGEIEVMTNSTANVYQDGAGRLAIKPLHTGTNPLTGWTSGRIETQRFFDAPPGGSMAFEASLQQPDVSGTAAAGYWPAFWALGSAYRGNHWNWPNVGEIDMMEDHDGLSKTVATVHFGADFFSRRSLSSGERDCSGCQTGFHTYRVEIDRSVSPTVVRWYLDGASLYTATKPDNVTNTIWSQGFDHPFFLILNVAIDGNFAESPTSATVAGVPMLVDYVRVYRRGAPFTDDALTETVSVVRAAHILELRSRIDTLRQRLLLDPFTWADAGLSAGTTIRAQHLVDLRTALAQAYDAAGRTVPSWTDAVLSPGFAVKAVHIAELRTAVTALEVALP